MSENKKSAWTDCVPWDDRPKTIPEGLQILADWFDAVYDEAGTDAAVQSDLRDWAKKYIELDSRVRELEAKNEMLDKDLMLLLKHDLKTEWDRPSLQLKLARRKLQS